MKTLPTLLMKIAKKLQENHARAVLVGGFVRDMVMGREVKDYDIEVYGLENLEQLETILSAFGRVNQVGKSFGVVKLKAGEEEYDFSFPRQEQKSGRGHRGFTVSVNGALSFREAARRRDFTVNAIGYDILSEEILDPFGGLQDIQYRVLRHIEDETFIEDPLRVYRAVQFSARFGFEVSEGTAELCKQMVMGGSLDELPKERVYEEWKKLLLKAPQPSAGFELMREWGITVRYFPELHALIGVPQDPKWHPEGDVWVHTMLSLDSLSRELRMEEGKWKMANEKERLKLLFAILCHDFGKPLTTTIEYENGEVAPWQEFKYNDKIVSQETHTEIIPHSVKRIRAINHEKAGIEPTRTFMYRLVNAHDFIESILPLVEHHLKPSQFYTQGAKAAAIRRLSLKVNIEELVVVAKADFLGRTTAEALRGIYEAGEWLLERAEQLHVKHRAPEPLLQGRDLIMLGLEPSPLFKTILDEVYALQLDGEVKTKEEALAYVKKSSPNFPKRL
jgi:tRNA nucleotidyltransferase (CCA-adding enzyme)